MLEHILSGIVSVHVRSCSKSILERGSGRSSTMINISVDSSFIRGKMHSTQSKAAFLSLLVLWMLSSTVSSCIVFPAASQHLHLSAVESELIARINGTETYDYALELERIALSNSTSNHSFRSSGSPGAEETAEWIQDMFEGFGLDTHLESFEFVSWNLLTPPVLAVDDDGNRSTTADQIVIHSFQCEHYSWPTPSAGVFTELVSLPLPPLNTNPTEYRTDLPTNNCLYYAQTFAPTLATARYDISAWSTIDTTGKVLLMGREVLWNSQIYYAFKNKVVAQPPAAIIFTWWYDWMSWCPPISSPCGGRPSSRWGQFYWQSKTPVGWVNNEDGQLILSRMASNAVSAFVSVQTVIGSGPHHNVVGKLTGSVNPEKTIMITSHYDTVMAPGFCDNGAGVSGLMELAHAFSDAAREKIYKPECTLVFVAFTGAELGSVGAIKYAEQHLDELKNVAAIINLDGIGSDTLKVSRTFPDDSGLNLQDIVLKASSDLDVKVELTGFGGSDQEVFRDPVATSDAYYASWWLRTGMRNATRVKSSIMLSSLPLFYNEGWRLLKPGWSQTQDDSSTSTKTLGWIDAGHLETQLGVAGLSIVRVLSEIYSPLFLQVCGSITVAGIILALIAYLERSRLGLVYEKVRRAFRSYIGLREILYVAILTVILLFILFALSARFGETEITLESHLRVVPVQYYGAPFEMFTMVNPPSQFSPWDVESLGSINILWPGFLLNAALCSVSSFAITFATVRTLRRNEISKLYSKPQH